MFAAAIHPARKLPGNIILCIAVTCAILLPACSLDAGRYVVAYRKSGTPAVGYLLALHNDHVLLQPNGRLPGDLLYRGKREDALADQARSWEMLKQHTTSIPLVEIDSVCLVGDNKIPRSTIIGVVGTALGGVAMLYGMERGYLSLRGANTTEVLTVAAVLGLMGGVYGFLYGLIASIPQQMLHATMTDFKAALIDVSGFNGKIPPELNRIVPPTDDPRGR